MLLTPFGTPFDVSVVVGVVLSVAAVLLSRRRPPSTPHEERQPVADTVRNEEES
jgi:hypothetical protein